MRVHFLGICGIAMGQVAIELARLGYTVTGADDQCLPPMSERLARAGITVGPLSAAGSNLPPCDILVAGRWVGVDCLPTGPDRPPIISLPSLVGQLTAQAQCRWVVAGSKGKTTTTAMLAWIAEKSGLAPDYFIGGLPGGFPTGIRLNGGQLAILEGDEYPSSPLDGSPKFQHYRPTDVVLTGVFPDHPDVYPDFGRYCGLFEELLQSLPPDGAMIAAGDAAWGVSVILKNAGRPAETIGFEPECRHRITAYQPTGHGVRFDFLGTTFHLAQAGKANALDAALAAAAAQRLGVNPALAAAALRSFIAVKDRLEESGLPGGIRLVLNSSAHPAALEHAVAALRERYPEGRLLCIVQPQWPGGGHGYAQRRLPEALACATHVVMAPETGQKPDAFDPPFSCHRVVEELNQRGVEAVFLNTRRSIVSWISSRACSGDTILLAVHAPSRPVLAHELEAALAQPQRAVPS